MLSKFMRTCSFILGVMLAVATAIPAMGAADETLHFSGPSGSIHSGTIVTRDVAGAGDSWTISVEGSHPGQVVLGLRSDETESSDVDIEIPFLVLVPAAREKEFQAVVVVRRGTHIVSTTEISIHRTRDLADLNADDAVNSADLTVLLAAWGRCARASDCLADLDGDGWVDGRDLSALVAAWQP